MSVRRAVVSVWDKRGIEALGRGLESLGIEILSTGGTAAALERAGVRVRSVADFTGFPEILDGRVKTLHPRIYAGLLARRDNPSHLEELRRHDIPPVDMVVVNLYPFRQTVARPGVTPEEAIEQIDIGGPCMIRAAAKNHRDVLVLTDPAQYGPILEELRANGGVVSEPTRRRLAVAAFAHTSLYDAAIHRWLADAGEAFPEILLQGHRKRADLRYGENPHQKAAVYAAVDAPGEGGGIVGAERLSGADLSYNNLVDLEAALTAVRDLADPGAVVIKHTNPCGAAQAGVLAEAVAGAFRGDPEAAFGGIVGVNRTVDGTSAEEMTRKGRFLEAIVAPDYEDDALAILRGRPGWGARLRILRASFDPPADPCLRYLEGGLLMQDRDRVLLREKEIRVAAGFPPDPERMASLLFAMTVCRHVKSNAIVLAQGREIVGVGAGQMSRIESLRIAVRKAGERVRGAVLASDAFFPFRDSIDMAAVAGIVAVIQPGGSKKDDEVIQAAGERGITLLLTGYRHFLH